MTIDRHAFIVEFATIATAAQKEEIAFRRNIAAEIERRERARQFAYRRLEVARLMAAAAVGAATAEDAHAKQVDALKGEFGWHADTERRKTIFAAWQPITLAVWEQVKPATAASETAGEGPNVGEAFSAFEAWYETEFGSPFLAILDHEIPEMPVVEF